MTVTEIRKKVTARLRSLIGSVLSRPWIMVLIVIVVMAVPVLLYWDWLGQHGANGKETNGATLRNISLALAVLIGVPLAAWRGLTAHDQAKAAHDQAETSGADLRNGRYQAGAGMLGNTVLSTRLGGIYALERLAQDHPDEYHIQIMDILSAFVRHPIEDEIPGASMPKHPDPGPGRRFPEDRNEAIKVIGRRSNEQVKTENAQSYRVNLSYANLGGAILGGADFTRVEGLVQDQLDTAVQHPDHGPPIGLPEGLTWDEDAAKERYLSFIGEGVGVS